MRVFGCLFCVASHLIMLWCVACALGWHLARYCLCAHHEHYLLLQVCVMACVDEVKHVQECPSTCLFFMVVTRHAQVTGKKA